MLRFVPVPPRHSSLSSYLLAPVRSSVQGLYTLTDIKIGIKDFLEDLNAQLLNTITTEFDKVEGNPVPEPSRTSADLASMVASSSTSNGGGAAGDPLDDLFPRVEVDGLLKGTTILADSKSDSWKTKKEGLEAFQSILDQGSNKRLKSSMGTFPPSVIFYPIDFVRRRYWSSFEGESNRHK